jgi:hypothetical protein
VPLGAALEVSLHSRSTFDTRYTWRISGRPLPIYSRDTGRLCPWQRRFHRSGPNAVTKKKKDSTDLVPTQWRKKNSTDLVPTQWRKQKKVPQIWSQCSDENKKRFHFPLQTWCLHLVDYYVLCCNSWCSARKCRLKSKFFTWSCLLHSSNDVLSSNITDTYVLCVARRYKRNVWAARTEG